MSRLLDLFYNQGRGRPIGGGGGEVETFFADTVPNLKFWLKANSISGSDANLVTTWVDSSGNNHHATEATAPPILKLNIVNGKPVVRFNGTDQYMSITSHADFALAAPWHMFSVLSLTATTVGEYRNWITKPGAWGFYRYGAMAGWVSSGKEALNSLYNYYEVNIFMLLETIFDSSNDASYLVNGWLKETVAGSQDPTVNANPLRLSWDGGTTYTPCDIAEVLLYTGAVAAADRSLIRNYLASKYGFYISAHDVDWATAARAAAPLTTPTHDGHGNGVQPDVVYDAAGWNGYNYWMMFTSYPADDHSEALELLMSNDGNTWTTGSASNPINGEPPATHFWADPCLFFSPDGLTLNCVYLDYKVGDPNKLYLTTSTDGITWTAAVLILTSDGTESLTSPSIVWDGVNYNLWTCHNTGALYTLNRRICSTLTGTWSSKTTCVFKVSYGTTIATKPPATFPSHGHVKLANGIYYGFYSDTATGMFCLLSSADGVTWQFPRHGPGFPQYTMGLGGAGVWDRLPYSGSILKLVSGFDLFYSAVDIGGTTYNIGRTTITGIV